MNKLYLLFALTASANAQGSGAWAGDCKNTYDFDFNHGFVIDECGSWCLDALYAIEYAREAMMTYGAPTCVFMDDYYTPEF